ncbi:hypothetical protein VTK26DRAFT_8729 [Humicola hyalothermophila]
MASQANKLDIRPSVDEAHSLFEKTCQGTARPTLLPVCITVPSDLLTPSAIYLKLSNGATAEHSFLLESATGSTETVGRYSFIGANPRKVLATGPGYEDVGDPMRALQGELGQDRVLSIPSLKLPSLTGGAVGYIGYDCIKYFEPKTARPLKDNLHIPEALFMLFDTLVAFDHFYQALTIVTHMRLPDTPSGDFQAAYDQACETIRETLDLIKRPETPLPPKSPPADPSAASPQYASNVGRHGYESFVTSLKSHIIKGDIIQAVPSQRFSRPTRLHPFNIYRTLRTLNPSPYLFFLSCSSFHIVGASPECLMKTDGYAKLPADSRFGYSQSQLLRPRIVNHAIAGTIRRGANPAEDDALAAELQASTKDRAEHVMLVDLARNDVNRVCHPSTVRVDRLMRIDRFSHVQHLTSEVSGLLRPECTRWDAMRSIFPAGTVSGAPKIKAMELIYGLEGEKRGIYAGAAGWFAYDVVRVDEDADGQRQVVVDEGQMDTCIAIRTMLVKDQVAYLQAGGGIVFDSEKTEEWMETMNKLAANLRCIELAEKYYGDGLGSKSVQEIIEEERRKGDEYYRLQTMSAGA